MDRKMGMKEGSSAKEALDDILHAYNAMKEICNAAKNRIHANQHNDFAKKIIPSKFLSKGKADTYFDSLEKKVEEHFIMDIVATFERVVFDRIGTACGEIENIVKDECNQREKNGAAFPLYESAPNFIKDKEDINNLSGIKNLLKIPRKKKLEEIINHRNWISHGKRAGVGKSSNSRIQDMHKELTDILNQIRI